MTDEHDHAARVGQFFQLSREGDSPEQLVRAFGRGFAAVWERAHDTLGDITLSAIGDRVLYNAAGEYPVLSCLRLSSTGLDCQALEQRAASLALCDLEAAVSFVLEEFLTVLGSLTAGVMTPPLHAALERAAGRNSLQAAQATQPAAEQSLRPEPLDTVRNRAKS